MTADLLAVHRGDPHKGALAFGKPLEELKTAAEVPPVQMKRRSRQRERELSIATVSYGSLYAYCTYSHTSLSRRLFLRSFPQTPT